MRGRERRKYQKTVEALAYLAERERRLYWLLKMLWWAEREHLSKYGQMIVGDTYIAMSKGPVPSMAYDIVKDARGDNWYGFENPDPADVLEAPDNYTVLGKRKANTTLLSETDREELDSAIKKIAPLSFGDLKKMSHTAAHEAADENDVISFEAFAGDLQNGELVLDYLKNR